MQETSTKDKILLTAGPIFAEKGFEAATVREICEVASVNVASINYYFGDKAQLYLETVRAARQRRAEKFPFDENLFNGDPLHLLRGFIRTLLNRLMALQSAPWEIRLLMREVMNPTEACRHLSQDYFRPFFELLLQIIQKISKKELEKHELEKLGYSVIGQILFYRMSADLIRLTTSPEDCEQHFDIEQLTEHVFRFSSAGILAASQSEDMELK